MAVFMSLGGNSAGDGFLLVPLGSNYEAEIALWTDAGMTSVTVQADPAHNVAGLVFSTAAPINISTVPTIVTVHATMQSASRGDTTIQVLEGAVVRVNFTVTSISLPAVNFNGRFEARFATDNGLPWDNPTYTAVNDNVTPINGSNGWTWALEGEPDFAPGSPVPVHLDWIGMQRVIRLNNPVALRPLGAGTVPDVVSRVVSITGQIAAMPPNQDQTFTAGDPLIGQPVNFGPDTYFAANTTGAGTTGSGTPEEHWYGGSEPLALFQIRIGTSFSPPALYFRGSSNVGPFVAAGPINTHTRTPDSRPISILVGGQLPDATAEFTAAGLPDLQTFSGTRIDALVTDYLNPVVNPPGPSTIRRNLVRRIGHLLPSVSAAKKTSVQAQAVAPDVFSVRIGTLQVWPQGAQKGVKEHYVGKVDADLHAWPGASPGASSVITYMTEFAAGGFHLDWNAFGFHSDELCGYHTGSLSTDMAFHGGHIGDPHTHTVDGTAYDFQAVGEFTLLRDGAQMEVQVRQTPVPTANPIKDDYTGLTACVSVNTAIAARVGAHRISFQPGPERQRLQFYLDGKPAVVSGDGIDLAGSRVTTFDANGETGLRTDYQNGTVVIATPRFWNNVWILDISISNTQGYEGVMGFVAKGSWLPRLRNGQSVGPMPPNPHDRYHTLYKTFADSWRVTDKTSLFVYAPGTSTKTFTDHDWPAEKPPCTLKPQFQIPGFPVLKGMPVDRAEVICRIVTDKDLHKNCVFDVATTGDENFAKGYRFAEDLRLYETAIQITGYTPVRPRDNRPPEQQQSLNQWVAVTAKVLPITSGRPAPTGMVTFYVDNVPMRRAIKLDAGGMAGVILGPLKPGEHKIRATYSGGGEFDYYSSSSPNLIWTIAPEGPNKPTAADQPVPVG